MIYYQGNRFEWFPKIFARKKNSPFYRRRGPCWLNLIWRPFLENCREGSDCYSGSNTDAFLYLSYLDIHTLVSIAPSMFVLDSFLFIFVRSHSRSCWFIYYKLRHRRSFCNFQVFNLAYFDRHREILLTMILLHFYSSSKKSVLFVIHRSKNEHNRSERSIDAV